MLNLQRKRREKGYLKKLILDNKESERETDRQEKKMGINPLPAEAECRMVYIKMQV